jgi:DNA-directed RNA polymerase subunit M/transcription elongation factor TFIIS
MCAILYDIRESRQRIIHITEDRYSEIEDLECNYICKFCVSVNNDLINNISANINNEKKLAEIIKTIFEPPQIVKDSIKIYNDKNAENVIVPNVSYDHPCPVCHARAAELRTVMLGCLDEGLAKKKKCIKCRYTWV